jgi:hypothetical protein
MVSHGVHSFLKLKSRKGKKKEKMFGNSKRKTNNPLTKYLFNFKMKCIFFFFDK